MNKAIFLDRDGVLIKSTWVPTRFTLDDFIADIIPGVPEALAKLKEAGWMLFVVTNQPDPDGSRKQDISYINQYMVQNWGINGIVACTHMPYDGCACHKPAPGGILTLCILNDVSPALSVMIGDRRSDKEAALNAGCDFRWVSDDMLLPELVDQILLTPPHINP